MKISWIITASFLLLHTGLHAKDLEKLKKDPDAFCSKGWYPFGELCYKGFPEGSRSDTGFSDKLKNFAEAEKMCVQLGGHLATISSSEVQDFVTTQILLTLEIRAYIGLRLNESDKNMHHWVDGSALNFAAWDTNEPSLKAPGGENEHCVEMTFVNVLSRMGKWNDIACDVRLPYICEKAKGFDGTAPEKDQRLCSWSTDGLYFRKSCYHFSPHRKSWEDAEQYCMDQYNGHLASVTDVAVQMFLSYNMVNNMINFNRMWIGIRFKPDDITLWSSGWYMGFNNWKKTLTPKIISSDSCGAMVKGTVEPYGQWSIGSCKESLTFICENSSVIPPPRLNASKTGLSCPPEHDDWIDLGGDYCYVFRTTDWASWYYANFICMTKGGTLASIHSAAEELVLEQFVRFSQNALHIGLFRDNRSQTNVEFVWADRSAVDYKNWDYGEPNNKDEMCAETKSEMKWNDVKCDSVRGFICSVRKVALNDTEQRSTCNQEQDKCECLPTPAIVGVVLCVLLVIVLLGVVLYNVKPWRKSQPDSPKRKSSLVTVKPRYRTGQRAVSEQIYENVDA